MPGVSKDERISMMGSRIRSIRLEQDMEQKELARHIGISSSHLSDIERGKKRPSYEVLGKISEELNISLDYLLLDSITGAKGYLQNEQLAEIVEQCNAKTTRRLIQYAKMLLEDQKELEKELKKAGVTD